MIPALVPDGRRWLATPFAGQYQYVSGAVDAAIHAAQRLRSAIDVEFMVGLGVGPDMPPGSGAALAKWAQKFKAEIGPEGELKDVDIRRVIDALTQIYSDDRNLDLLIVKVLAVAAAIANGSPEDEVQERLGQLRQREN